MCDINVIAGVNRSDTTWKKQDNWITDRISERTRRGRWWKERKKEKKIVYVSVWMWVNKQPHRWIGILMLASAGLEPTAQGSRINSIRHLFRRTNGFFDTPSPNLLLNRLHRSDRPSCLVPSQPRFPHSTPCCSKHIFPKSSSHLTGGLPSGPFRLHPHHNDNCTASSIVNLVTWTADRSFAWWHASTSSFTQVRSLVSSFRMWSLNRIHNWLLNALQ